jgi:hypothetical protein
MHEQTFPAEKACAEFVNVPSNLRQAPPIIEELENRAVEAVSARRI